METREGLIFKIDELEKKLTELVNLDSKCNCTHPCDCFEYEFQKWQETNKRFLKSLEKKGGKE